jgi:serine/threonine-protein kinase
LSAERRLELVCAGVEASWQLVEDFLGKATEQERSALRVELERLELHYLSRNSALPPTAEYVAGLPQYAALIAQHSCSRAPTAPGPVDVALDPTPFVPGYQNLGQLARGAMGVVYKARQLSLNRLVALKMILAGGNASPDALARFRVEGEAAARLQHPNIVQVYGVGKCVWGGAECPYIVMELVEGGSLAQLVCDKPPSQERAAELVAVLGRAMHHAHQRGVIHRDLKPANILLTETGSPKIADFGLAKCLDADSTSTRTGTVLGSLPYLPPEQASESKEEVTTLADVYCLGAVLYELLTGRRPFQGANVPELLRKVREEKPLPPRSLNRGVVADLETICLTCLEKKPGQRYSSALALAEDLESYLRGEAIKARQPSWAQMAWRELEKRRLVLDPWPWSTLSFVAAVVVFLTHLGIYWIARTEQPAALFWLCISIHWVLAAVLAWKYNLRRRQLLTPDERHILSVWASFCLSAIVLSVLAYPWDREGILALYPPLALLTGLYHFVIARFYWGRHYLIGITYYLLAIAIRLDPRWGPVAFGCLYAVNHIIAGFLLRHYARQGSNVRHPQH